jgi:hypothetical protein
LHEWLGEGAEKLPGFVNRREVLALLIAMNMFGMPEVADASVPGDAETEKRKLLDSIKELGDEPWGPSLSDLEITLAEVLEKGSGYDDVVLALVDRLEENGGTQMSANVKLGYWCVPWVGGWVRRWTSDTNMTRLGGPAVTKFTDRATGNTYTLLTARQFIYGPGKDGFYVEYLYSTPGEDDKRVLFRQGNIANRGDSRFEADFARPLSEYKVKTGEDDEDRVDRDFGPIRGGGEVLGPAFKLKGETSYLSERLWIMREEFVGAPAGAITIWGRTDTRAVIDRRGLVAEGQKAPPEDDTIRYGGLLFSDKPSDYDNWDKQQKLRKADQDKMYR